MTYNAAFERLEATFRGLDRAPVDRDERLLLESDANLAVYYAAFDHFNRDAKVLLVGITPGPTQMRNANSELWRALRRGWSVADAMREAKRVGAFSGPLRRNLVIQLDHWGVQSWLGIESSRDLFESSRDFIQTTSLLRYPVFLDGKPYDGRPNMLQNRMLRRLIDEVFVAEVAALRDAVVLPLGPKVSSVVEVLCGSGLVDRRRVATGLFHPSPQNGYRVAYAVGGREGPVPHRTNVTLYDAGRSRFRKRYLGE